MTDYFHLNAAPDTVRAISSLGLAHLGDGVFELMVRSWLCLHGKATSKGLHRGHRPLCGRPGPGPGGGADSPPAHRGGGGRVPPGPQYQPPQRAPERQPGGFTRPPPGWRPCSAGCGFRAAQSGSTNCLL